MNQFWSNYTVDANWTTVYLCSFCICILAYILHAWAKQRRYKFEYFKRLGIPFVKPHFLYGSFHLLRDSKGDKAIHFHSHWKKTYGNVFGYFAGPRPYLVVFDLDMIKDILIKEFHSFVNRPKQIIELKPFIDTVIGLRDKQWKNVRSVITPTFSVSKLKVIVDQMNKNIDEMVNIIEERSKLGQPVEMFSIYQGLIFDVICEYALAFKSHGQRDQNQDPLLSSVRKLMKYVFNPAIKLGIYFPFFAKVVAFVSTRMALSGRAAGMIVSNMRNVMDRRRQNSAFKCTDILQRLMDVAEELKKKSENSKVESLANGELSQRQQVEKSLTDDEIIANCLVVLLAGFEAKSSALACTSYLLAKHPDIQEKLYREISEHIKNGAKHLSYDDIKQLPYLDQVFNESLRFYTPVVTFITREAGEDIVIKDTVIPKGTGIVIPVWDIHHNPEYWPEPNKFDPERFSTSQVHSENRHPMTFIPFGEGPRKCLGMRLAQMEVKLTLARILLTFRLEMCYETPDSLSFDVPTVSLYPSQNVLLKAVKRNV